MRGMHLNPSKAGTLNYSSASHKAFDNSVYIALSHLNRLTELTARQA
jgi:hypothetical protein